MESKKVLVIGGWDYLKALSALFYRAPEIDLECIAHETPYQEAPFSLENVKKYMEEHKKTYDAVIICGLHEDSLPLFQEEGFFTGAKIYHNVALEGYIGSYIGNKPKPDLPSGMDLYLLGINLPSEVIPPVRNILGIS